MHLFLTLYMFRAHRAHHQERQIVSIQPVVAVTVCRWPRPPTHRIVRHIGHLPRIICQKHLLRILHFVDPVSCNDSC